MIKFVYVILSPFLHIYIDPDITRGDGVYSRYLPRLAGRPGRYLLSADVDDNGGRAVVAQGPPARSRVPLPPRHLPPYYHQQDFGTWGDGGTCCGSSLLYFHSRTAPPFQRHLTFGVLEVVSPPNPRDLTPPSRILDLRVEVNDTVHEIFLRWTAPGDDWDVGRADHYEAVVAPQWAEARAFEGDTLTGLPRPLPPGTFHTTNLHFIRYEEVSFLLARTSNHNEEYVTGKKVNELSLREFLFLFGKNNFIFCKLDYFAIM